MSYHFHWSVLWTGQSGTWLLQGLVTTLELSLLAWLLAFMLGIVSGALRTAPIPPLRWVSTFYGEFFRNVPLLVWMFFWYFAIPPLLPESLQNWLFDHGVEFGAGWFALGVYHGARFSEVMRSGIQSIPKTQLEASLSTGLTVQTRQIETYPAKAFEALTAGTLIYLILCLAIAAAMARVERRVAIPGMIAQSRAGEF